MMLFSCYFNSTFSTAFVIVALVLSSVLVDARGFAGLEKSGFGPDVETESESTSKFGASWATTSQKTMTINGPNGHGNHSLIEIMEEGSKGECFRYEAQDLDHGAKRCQGFLIKFDCTQDGILNCKTKTVGCLCCCNK